MCKVIIILAEDDGTEIHRSVFHQNSCESARREYSVAQMALATHNEVVTKKETVIPNP